jgi:C-terminal processing protease CtpA/Prc
VKTFRRADDPQVTVDYTLPQLDGERMPAADLFILTGSETFSAAEAFAFGLQKRGRATVVGARTKGGANAGRYVTIVHGFRAFVPMAHASDAYSDESWEGVGITPDVATPEADALDRAYREALTRLSARARTPDEKKALDALLAQPLPH